jgi:DNA repair exonuclease SbcCD ATPase subunit
VLNEKTQPLPFSPPEEESERPRRRSAPPDRFLFALVWTLAAMAVIGLLSVLWLRELDRRKDAEKQVSSAQAEVRTAESRLAGMEEEVAALEGDLASARADLKPWRARAARRGETLRSTRGVIALVPPLSESYDDLGELLTTIDADGDALAAAAAALEREVTALAGYIRRTDENELSKRELQRRATTLRARLTALRTTRLAFVEAQAGYGDVADLVDARFDELTRAVSALRKEIAKALRR